MAEFWNSEESSRDRGFFELQIEKALDAILGLVRTMPEPELDMAESVIRGFLKHLQRERIIKAFKISRGSFAEEALVREDYLPINVWVWPEKTEIALAWRCIFNEKGPYVKSFGSKP